MAAHANAVQIVLTTLAAALCVVYRRQIREALERFHPRGPRPPSAPLPANDSFILGRKRRISKVPFRSTPLV